MPRPLHPAFKGLLWLLVAGLGFVTLLSRLGRVSWFFELFAHFPLQYAIGLAGVSLVALVLRQWRPALVAVFFLLPNLLALSYYYPTRSDPDTAVDLRVLTFNVLTSNSAHGPVREFLAGSDADFLLVMETDRNWIEALAPLEADYPHVLKVPRGDNFGMAFFSRHPIESHELFSVEGSRVPCLSAVVSVDGKQIDVIGGHPVPPVGGANAASRNAYLAALAKLVTASDRPTIVMGDFNVSVWSPYFREFMESTALHDTGRKRGFQATWHRESLPFAIPIDHILHSGELQCISRTVGPDLGSDHRAVIAEFAF